MLRHNCNIATKIKKCLRLIQALQNSLFSLHFFMQTDTSNINFQLATDFINYTNRSVFLTGKAGSQLKVYI